MNESIAISIIDRNVYLWYMANITFSQKPKPIRPVASDGLTNIYKRRSH